MKEPIRIIIIEDNSAYRDVIYLALNDHPKFNIIGEFAVCETALRNLETKAENEQPQAILLDLNLPGMSGLEAIEWFKKYCPEVKIIVLSQSDNEGDVLSALDLGADGYLLKSATLDQITDSIEFVMAGGIPLDAHITKFILKAHGKSQVNKNDFPSLSTRELEVLKLLANGLIKKEIAHELNIGITTVVTHVSHIFEKLEAPNAPAAINKAHQLGLFTD